MREDHHIVMHILENKYGGSFINSTTTCLLFVHKVHEEMNIYKK